jgi:hypothetical protein
MAGAICHRVFCKQLEVSALELLLATSNNTYKLHSPTIIRHSCSVKLLLFFE